MKHHSSRSHALVISLLAVGITMAGVNSSSASDSLAEGQPLQAGLAASVPAAANSPATSWLSTFARLESSASGELASRIGAESAAGVASVPAAEATPPSPILGSHPSLGQVAAPITRFRDGGHAYYLFGAGLHSCTYVGKCMDLFAPIGEPVYAMADGDVKIPPYAPSSYGNYIIMKLRDGTKAIYAHLKEITVKPGPIAAGTQIGTVGCSGTSGEFNKCKASEQHLHLEWSGLEWNPGEYGQLPPFFTQWRGEPQRCFKGCGPNGN